MSRSLWVSVLALLLGACAAQPPAEQLRAALPATYVGTLPCADCPALDYSLLLRADGNYFLRRDYVERGAVDEIGRWLLSSDQKVLALQGGERFAIDSGEQLTLRDSNGAAIAVKPAPGVPQGLNYSLRRSETALPPQPQLKLRGSYLYSADAATFTECRTGLQFAVLPSSAAQTLQSAYLSGRGAPGEPLLVALAGRLTEAVVGAGEPQPALEVTRFLQPLPEPACGSTFAPASLVGTAWLVTQLGGQALDDDGGARPSLQFDADKERVSGFTGCNRLVGGYKIGDNALQFGELAATRMACPGASILEVTFTDALKAVASYAIIGDQLELYDAEGTLLLRFAADKGAR